MTSQRKKIITAALPYVNNSPHLGNILGSVLSADVYARFCRKNNKEVVFICGTDDYGTATEIKAKQENTTCEKVVETNRNTMVDVFRWFNIEFDEFGQTSSKGHAKVVQDIFWKIQDRIEKGTMQQYYCDGCSMFLADRYLTGTCGKCKTYGVQGDQCDACGIILKVDEIVEPECSICKGTPYLKETEHLFLKLNEEAENLKKKYEKFSGEWSKNSREITLQWLENDLHSRCITRDLKWGVPVPGMNKVFYVWFDALLGYLSIFKQYLQKKSINEGKSNISEKNKKDDLDDLDTLVDHFNSYELVQFMGKDNVPFHTIIFPAISDFIASKLSVTEYLMFENKKFSKSKGIGIFGIELIGNDYGTSDLWRYYLIKIRPEHKDSNFSVTDFVNSVTELQNNFGNLCQRVLKYIKNKMNGTVKYDNKRGISEKAESENEKIRSETVAPKDKRLTSDKGGLEYEGAQCDTSSSKNKVKSSEEEFIKKIRQLSSSYKEAIDQIKMKKGLAILSEISTLSNNFLQKAFEQKLNQQKKNETFSLVFSVIAHLSDLYEPFIPNVCGSLQRMCNVKGGFNSEFILFEEHTIGDVSETLFKPLSEDVIERFSKKTASIENTKV